MNEERRDQADESLGDTVSRTLASGKRFAEAEIARQKLKGMLVARGARDIAICVTAALLLLPAVIVAVLIGVIVGLTPEIGIWCATAVAAGGAALLALLALLIARLRLNRLKRDIAS